MICPRAVKKGGITKEDAMRPFLLLNECPLCSSSMRIIALNYVVKKVDPKHVNSYIGLPIDENYINQDYILLFRSGIHKELDFLQCCTRCSYARNCKKVWKWQQNHLKN